MDDVSGHPLLTNSYGSMGEIRSQIMADGRTLRYRYDFDKNRRVNDVELRDDHGFVTRSILGRGGFYASLPEKKGDSAVP